MLTVQRVQPFPVVVQNPQVAIVALEDVPGVTPDYHHHGAVVDHVASVRLGAPKFAWFSNLSNPARE